jgi:hypothetical protein
MIRTIPLEIGLSAHDHACPNIGPFQKLKKSILSNARSVSQAVATLPSTVESPSLFGGQPVVFLNPFQNALQLADNESFSMNMTTAQAVHDGN